jgi:carbon starvation protein
MQQIITNDYIDATLAAIFMAVVLSILYFSLKACIQAFRESRPTTAEAGASGQSTAASA